MKKSEIRAFIAQNGPIENPTVQNGAVKRSRPITAMRTKRRKPNSFAPQITKIERLRDSLIG